MTSNGCCGLWMVGVWRWIPTGATVILSRIGPVGSSRHSGSLGDLHCLCTTCGTSAIFWIFWMIGTCDVKSAAVSSRQSSGFPGWSWTVSASLGAPSLYRLDCWYLVLRHNLEIYDPANVLGLWNSLPSVCRATQRVHPQPHRRTALAG